MPASAASLAYRTARDALLAHQGSHAEAVATFRWPDLGDRFNWAADWFDVVAEDNDRLALVIAEQDGTRTVRTYEQMAARSNQVGRFLAGLGIGRGDSVLLMLGNQVELWESMLGVMKLGAVIVPTTTALGTADLVDRVDRAEARCVIAGASDVGKFADVPGDFVRVVIDGEVEGWTQYTAADREDDGPLPHPGTAAADRLLLYFTSGTTSRPKLVEHTQVSYPVGHLTTAYWIGLRAGDLHLNISSPGWAKHAWSCFFAPWIAEATIYVYNYRRFDAGALLTRIREDGVTTFCAPPTVWRMVINSDLSGGPGGLREIVAAGEPLNPEVISQVERAWGLTLRDGFGQTETTLTVANTPGSVVKPGSMGRPLPGCPVVLVDPLTGEQAREGEICIDLSGHPLNVMTGYVGDAEAKAGGYYHSGDVATCDSDGYLTYIGRTDDVFKASDYKISPFELESVLIEHPAVVEAAVVPAPDPVRLAVPKAYVALAEGWAADAATALAILQHARDRLPPYLRVRRIEFFDLPKTVSGKIRRVELRERELENAEGGLASEWREDQFPELSSAAP